MKVLSSGVDVIDDSGAAELAPGDPLQLPDDVTGTETILVVDDDLTMRDFLTAALERRGYGVLAATDGEEAIEVAAAHRAPIHLVLSDVVMPRLDGCTLISELRRWYPSIGVLLMSGYAEGGQAALEVPDELTFFIRKPFSMHALAHAVRSAIEWRPRLR